LCSYGFEDYYQNFLLSAWPFLVFTHDHPGPCLSPPAVLREPTPFLVTNLFPPLFSWLFFFFFFFVVFFVVCVFLPPEPPFLAKCCPPHPYPLPLWSFFLQDLRFVIHCPWGYPLSSRWFFFMLALWKDPIFPPGHRLPLYCFLSSPRFFTRHSSSRFMGYIFYFSRLLLRSLLHQCRTCFFVLLTRPNPRTAGFAFFGTVCQARTPFRIFCPPFFTLAVAHLHSCRAVVGLCLCHSLASNITTPKASFRSRPFFVLIAFPSLGSPPRSCPFVFFSHNLLAASQLAGVRPRLFRFFCG